MSFNIGDRVVIRRDSEFHGRSTNNPDDSVIGTVSRILPDDLPIRVTWDNGSRNVYGDNDLRLATPDFVSMRDKYVFSFSSLETANTMRKLMVDSGEEVFDAGREWDYNFSYLAFSDYGYWAGRADNHGREVLEL